MSDCTASKSSKTYGSRGFPRSSSPRLLIIGHQCSSIRPCLVNHVQELTHIVLQSRQPLISSHDSWHRPGGNGGVLQDIPFVSDFSFQMETGQDYYRLNLRIVRSSRYQHVDQERPAALLSRIPHHRGPGPSYQPCGSNVRLIYSKQDTIDLGRTVLSCPLFVNWSSHLVPVPFVRCFQILHVLVFTAFDSSMGCN
jgi:hypothetical protein